MTKPLEKQHILITGGQGHIGQTIAAAATKAGATVTLWDKQPANDKNDCSYQVDNTVEREISEAFDTLESMPDTIINCAGIFTNLKPLEALDLSEFNQVMQTNTSGCFLICREGLRRYKESLTIINMSSALSSKAIPMASAYCASKAAIDSLTRSIACEYGDKGVLAVNINPGPVAGSMLDSAINEISERMDVPTAAIKQQIMSVIPSGKLIEVEEIAAMALLIASGKGSAMQGKTINIDGGFTA